MLGSIAIPTAAGFPKISRKEAEPHHITNLLSNKQNPRPHIIKMRQHRQVPEDDESYEMEEIEEQEPEFLYENEGLELEAFIEHSGDGVDKTDSIETGKIKIE